MTVSMFKTAFNMMYLDLHKYYKKQFISDVINKTVWTICALVTAAYVWPKVGMSGNFGVFMAIGMIVSSAFWDVWGLSVQYVSDITGERVVDYYITLPIPTWLYFGTQITFYTCRSLVPSLIIMLLSKLILFSTFDLSIVCWWQAAIIIMLSTIFCSTFSLFVTSLVRDMDSVDNISMRFLLPMWFFGGSQFSWAMLQATVPLFAYINLFNPLIYAMEGVHVAFLGQAGYLQFWLCCMMLIIFSIVCAYTGARRLIKRLDCI